MARDIEEKNDLFQLQVDRLQFGHFLVLFWCTQSEGASLKYNITNCFDDLKHCGVTRTKQTAVALVETLHALCFVDIKDERNRKNIYITKWGGKALQQLIIKQQYEAMTSSYLEEYHS